ncbi:ABC transporter substrate-binding protein [Nocardioides albus]|uniref:Polar amino acid transport system substrate-binding protein n=1 Tax=Nocardioides albus TaxID=1841 RepID=A0A7W5F7J8_9ACTN|nr:ABC transporter substrate-binding protein [Nocardioides albus]MBB3088091.1 polar amino acid transport system substrate-binding protein [Nocardioides albus]GGU22499.1 amino acid ABC transporter substrate-binding protein [Nocardioides albus]
MRTRLSALLVVPLALAAGLTACGGESDTGADGGAPASCETADLPLKQDGKLTIGTDSPAYEPWFSENDPSNGKGFESAVAYAVADRLGFAKDDVVWVKQAFNTSYTPGEKKFDFDINQISITPERANVVDLSQGYYTASQAVVTMEKDAAKATSLADLKDLKLGAQTATTSLTAIREDVQPSTDPLVFDTSDQAKQALLNGQVDALVFDLPTAFYITAAEIEGSTITGQFESSSMPEEFGLLTEKDSGLAPCLDEALTALEKDGTLAELEQEWLSDVVSVPVLK